MHSLTISLLLMALAASVMGCKRVETPDSRRVDFLIWEHGQQAYQTNHLAEAYAALVKLKSDLREIQTAGRSNLDYVYCGAVLNGQLFAMAERLGETNAADTFYRESARCFEANHKSLRLPAKEFSRAEVHRLVEAYDTKTGPVLWRQEAQNSKDL